MSGLNRPARDLALLDAVDACAREVFDAPLWRICRSGRDPVQGSPSTSRWCDGSFDVLYTALERDGAVAEVHELLTMQPVFPSQVSWGVHRLRMRVEKTLRVVDVSVLARFGVDGESYRDRTDARTQAMAEAAFFLGFDGIVAPSARWSCLDAVLFTARIAPANLMLQNSESAPVDWDDWRRRSFDRRATELRAMTAGRPHTPAEDLLRESRDER